MYRLNLIKNKEKPEFLGFGSRVESVKREMNFKINRNWLMGVPCDITYVLIFVMFEGRLS